MSKHQKHAKLPRPKSCHWARSEWMIIGSSCSKINDLAESVAEHLNGQCLVNYVDTSHAKESPRELVFHEHQLFSNNAFRIESPDSNNKAQTNPSVLTLINGNHHDANNQIVIIDEIKRESLSKKLDRLTKVDLVLVKNSVNDIYDFLKPKLIDTSILKIDDIAGIANFLSEKYTRNIPPIKGLILKGGKSTRMGFDKSQIDYYGEAQYKRVFNLLSPFCQDTFFSEAYDYESSDDSVAVIKDEYLGLGPMAGILSAFKSDPNAAWLSIACDLPFIDNSSIEYLINNRNPNKIATCFIRSDAQFPDPLFTIWEPQAYPVLFSFLAKGYSCPRKVLINSDVQVIEIPDDKVLMNVNDKDELEKAKKMIT